MTWSLTCSSTCSSPWSLDLGGDRQLSDPVRFGGCRPIEREALKLMRSLAVEQDLRIGELLEKLIFEEKRRLEQGTFPTPSEPRVLREAISMAQRYGYTLKEYTSLALANQVRRDQERLDTLQKMT